MSDISRLCLQINTMKFNANWEITNTYENFQTVWSQFFSDKLIFIYIWSDSNIYWFISIQICCQRIQMKSYSVTICNIRSTIRWAIAKLISNYSRYLILIQSEFSRNTKYHFGQIENVFFLPKSFFFVSEKNKNRRGIVFVTRKS